jgi:hypothetical protein
VKVMSQTGANAEQLRETIVDQSFKAMGLSDSGLARRLLRPVFRLPAGRFSQLAAGFDRSVADVGLCETSRRYLPSFIEKAEVRGVEHIPAEGPLLMVSNHPGAFDGFVIASNLPRCDLKIVISGVPFVRALPAVEGYLIYLDQDAHQRMTVVRSMIRHISGGCMLLIYPSGRVDPDPEFVPGAREALELWSPSLELVLRKAPQTQVVVTIASGVLAPGWMRNPLVRVLKQGWERQRLAEFFQTMQLMLFPGSLTFSPKVSFAEPVIGRQLIESGGRGGVMPTIINRAQQLLDDHMASTAFQSMID